MNYNNNKISNLKIAYIGGGSRGWAWSMMNDLALDDQLSGEIALYDIDEKAANNNAIIGNRLSEKTDVNGEWHYQVYSHIEEALIGADFVIISILPGTFDEMESDVHTPEKYGVYQSVGDTAGPGGIMRNLRTIPMFVGFAKAIKEYAPAAWVINYTNPMSVCVKTLYSTFPAIKAFGCCHEVFGTQALLAGILEDTQNLTGVKRHDIEVNVLGINHFTWFDAASYRGLDIFPIYQKYVEDHFESGYLHNSDNWSNSSFNCLHRVKFDLFRKYGLIAAAGDRHLAEFMPGNQYLRNPEVVAEWKFALTPVSWRKQDLQQRLQKSARLVKGEEELSLQPSGEEGILLIKALCGLNRMVSNVNIPNYASQIANLPATAVVETNAIFSRDHISPVYAGKLPMPIKTLTMPHILNHNRVLEAAKTINFDLVIKAMSSDPQLINRLTHSEVVELTRTMIGKQLKYLPENWKAVIA